MELHSGTAALSVIESRSPFALLEVRNDRVDAHPKFLLSRDSPRDLRVQQFDVHRLARVFLLNPRRDRKIVRPLGDVPVLYKLCEMRDVSPRGEAVQNLLAIRVREFVLV